MRIINAAFYGTDRKFHKGNIETEGGVIKKIFGEDDSVMPCSDESFGEEIDASGMYVIPGLIDLHFHGALGYDVCDGKIGDFEKIAAYELSQGVTSICPATMTLPEEQLITVLSCGKRFSDEHAGDNSLSELIGFNMEGPFISHAKKGAQNEEFIKHADVSMAERFIAAAGGLLKIIGLAPEENPGFEDYIRAVKDKVTVSLAHTNADYDTAMKAIEAGAAHAVHLYNAMSSFSHRDPGVVNAVFDSESVNAELICDGIHVHPAAVRSAFSELSSDRVVFISDSLRAAGMPDGVYELGGQKIEKKGRICTLYGTSTISGSVSNLYECMTNAVKTMDIPLEDAVLCATKNPAKILGVSDRIGEISPGKQADLLIMDKELNLKAVIKRGQVTSHLSI
ncbi:MAG: N-acetylglucosamine-6-phosphate deacetylase [Lachnospiraceae bacterium]|nr:N-acetylglucosamine-6-phosphate deacetylase [Lachnospiraceae bacterium]